MSLTLSLRRSGAILLAGAAACLVAGPASAADTPPACPVTDAPSNAVATTSTPLPVEALGGHYRTEIGRASRWERVCLYVYISGCAISLTKHQLISRTQ